MDEIVLFHNDFSPSSEQSEQRVLAQTSWQPTSGCLFTKHGVITTNLTLRNAWGYITHVSKYHSAGMWSMG